MVVTSKTILPYIVYPLHLTSSLIDVFFSSSLTLKFICLFLLLPLTQRIGEHMSRNLGKVLSLEWQCTTQREQNKGYQQAFESIILILSCRVLKKEKSEKTEK